MHRSIVCHCKTGVVAALGFITSLFILAIFLHRQTPPKPIGDYRLVIRNEEQARESSKIALLKTVFANGQQLINFTTLTFGSFEEYRQWLSASGKGQLVNSVIVQRAGKEKQRTKLTRDDVLVSTKVDFANLLQFEIEYFHIKRITDTNVFAAYRSLRYLSLQNNKIESVNTNVFTSLRYLEVLDLRYNNIQHLDVLVLNKLVLLDVSNNPLRTVKGLRLGDNSPRGSFFSFRNTSLTKIDFCYQRLSGDEPGYMYAIVNLGESHELKCSCAFFLMHDNLTGQRCVSSNEATFYSLDCDWKFDRADLLCNNYGYIDDWRDTNIAQKAALLS